MKKKGIGIHEGPTYRYGSPQLKSAASEIAKVVQKLPKSHPLTLNIRVGQSIDLRRLGVTVYPGWESKVRWYSLAGMPAGFRLSQTGQLTGTATTAGSWTTTFRIRTAETGYYGAGRTGAIRWTINPAGESRTRWTSVVANWLHTCATRADGTAWCWGANDSGRLGDGTSSEGSTRPVQVGSADNWTSISAGAGSTCGLRVGGTAWCWGLNGSGEVGDGTDQIRTTPVQIPGAARWSSVTTGGEHSCGVQVSGTAWCWGSNWFGQLATARTRHGLPPQGSGLALTG